MEEYEHIAFSRPEESLLTGGFELAFFQRNIALCKVRATGLGTESEFILAIAVVVRTLDRVPAIASLQYE